MSSFLKKIDLIDLTDFPQYFIITDNDYIFNKAISVLKPNVIIYEGLYGVKVARAEYKDIRVGVAIYGFGHLNALWFLKEALQKEARVILKVGFSVNFGEEMNPVIVNYAVPYDIARWPFMLSIGNVELMSISNWVFTSNEISHTIESVISCAYPIDFLEEKELTELRKRYGIRLVDSDTAYIYDFANRWKAKSLSLLLPLIWSETLPDIGLWFDYEPSTKEEVEAATNLVRLALNIITEYNAKCESLKKGKYSVTE